MSEGRMDAGREMDALVAEHVMGHTRGFEKQYGELFISFPEKVLPRYSTEIMAAWTVVERFEREGFFLSLDRVLGGWSATFHRSAPESRRLGDTAPLAICRAALAEVGAEG